MKYMGTLIAVSDMERSKEFYCGLLGMEVTADFGANVTLNDNVFLQTVETWREFIDDNVRFQGNDKELYFEEDDMDAFWEKLKRQENIVYVHLLKEHAWGQRVVRFYDPDHHIIEVGENMAVVMKRFMKSGLSVEATAQRMDVPVSYVETCLKEEEDSGF